MQSTLPEPAQNEALRQNLKVVSVTKVLVGGAYGAKDTLSEATSAAATVWTFAIGHVPGAKGYIVKARVISETVALAPRLSLFLYRIKPTCNRQDNVANSAPLPADTANYIGRIDFPAMEAANLSAAGASEAMVVPGSFNGLPMSFDCEPGDSNLYGILANWDAFTQGSGDDMTVILTAERA